MFMHRQGNHSFGISHRRTCNTHLYGGALLFFFARLTLAFEQCGNDVCPYVLPSGHSKTLNIKLSGPQITPLEQVGTEVFDYIVVGGGGGGCPVARTLADGGKRVLLIERGGHRRDHILTHDIFGSGLVIDDERVSQVVITPTGVRTHLANVLGGGTATGMAIVIEEDDEYLNVLEALANEKINKTLYRQALDWVRSKLATPMSQDQPYTDALRRGLSLQGFPIEGGSTSVIQKNGTWNAFSLFNATDGYFRNSADVLLGGFAGDPQPSTLMVVLNSTVTHLDFEDTGDDIPKAVCVRVRPSGLADTAKLDGRFYRQSNLKSWWKSIASQRPLQALALLAEWLPRKEPYSVQLDASHKRFCARNEIILSTGAVQTPVLLGRSGVGSAEQLRLLGVTPVKVIPALGQNLIDRGLLPVAYFRRDPVAWHEELPPQICGIVGLAPHGANCSEYRMASREQTCAMTGVEEITGGRILEGFLYATRILFPPNARSSFIVDQLVELVRYCSDRPRHEMPLCFILRGGPQCFRKLSSVWYFVNEPKSRGEVTLLPNGNIIVNPRYYSHPQDVLDGTQGLANLIRMVNTTGFEDVLESPVDMSCPWIISSALTSLSKAIMGTSHTLISDDEGKTVVQALTNPNGQVKKKGTANMHLTEESLIEEISEGEPRSYDIENTLRESLKRYEEAFQIRNLLHTSNDSLNAIISRGEELWNTYLGDSLQSGRFPEDSTTRADTCTGCGKKGTIGPVLPPPAWLAGNTKIATYPPVLPQDGDFRELEEYMQNMMQSMWHLAGTASMGSVVDSQFRVKGVRGLSIVDASILPQVPRMNPTQTILGFGRYAGMLKLHNQVP